MSPPQGFRFVTNMTDLHLSDEAAPVNRQAFGDLPQNDGGVTAPMMSAGSSVGLVYQCSMDES